MNTSRHRDEVYSILFQTSQKIADENFTAEVVKIHLAKKKQSFNLFQDDGLLMSLIAICIFVSACCFYLLLTENDHASALTLHIEYRPLTYILLITTVGMLYKYFMGPMVSSGRNFTHF